MFIDPKVIIDQLGISGSEVVIDLGAGSGVYALEIAKRLGVGGGKVYAVDVQQDLLTRLAHSAQEEKLTNVSCVHADIERRGGVHLRENISDLVIVSNVLYSAEHKEELLGEAARLLRDGGRLLLIDWNGPYRGMGPEASQVVTEEAGKHLAEAAGFRAVRNLDGGDHHWALLCVKEGKSSGIGGFAL